MEAQVENKQDTNNMFSVRSFLITLVEQPRAADIGMLFSFDSASPGNPGPSASGVCALWGFWQHDAFVSRGLLSQKGSNLGDGADNSAEAYGLAAAIKGALRLHYWVIEQCADLAQHSVD